MPNLVSLIFQLMLSSTAKNYRTDPLVVNLTCDKHRKKHTNCKNRGHYQQSQSLIHKCSQTTRGHRALKKTTTTKKEPR